MAVCVCVDFTVYSLVYYGLGLGVYVSNIVAFCCGTLCASLSIRRFVFPEPKYSFLMDYLFTLANNGTVFVLGLGCIALQVEILGVHHLAAKADVLALTFLVNYFVRKHLLSLRPVPGRGGTDQ